MVPPGVEVLPRDRRRQVIWLREARKRFGLSVLDYMVTSNHIHLLVAENGKSETMMILLKKLRIV